MDERIIGTSEIGFDAASVEKHFLVTDADRRTLGQFAEALPRQFRDDLHREFLGALFFSQKNAPEAGAKDYTAFIHIGESAAFDHLAPRCP
ncbi:hypothetical protein [Pantoea agglomerans]|uniref:hypothetical protein n=1 Tax=Enterobacter agglomerans TaxID=549 RepID=UPI0024131F7B|nr:hypothetical protein [Pantoea agglomerans]